MKRVLASLLIGLCIACAPRHPVAAPRQSLEKENESAGSLRWLGGPTALLERGGFRLLTDPMLGPRGENAFVLPKHPSTGQPNAAIRRYVSAPEIDLSRLSAVLISHTHADHFDAAAKQSLPKDCPVIVAAAGVDALRAAGFTKVQGLDWGQSTILRAGQTVLKVQAVPAHHAHDGALDQSLGRGNGYLLEWQEPSLPPYRLYWTGDAVLSDESRTLTEQLGRVDLMLPHMGGVGGDGAMGLRTMDADEAVELVKRVAPQLVIPIHHTTFGHYREPIEALEQRVQELGWQKQFRFPKIGEPLSLAP